MTPIVDNIERTRRYLLGSSLPDDTKDNLQNLLDAAQGVSRSRNIDDMAASLASAVAALAIHEVRQAVRTPDIMQGAINAHLRDLHNGKNRLPQTRTEIFIYLFSRPWPWFALAVGVFSPHVSGIVEVVSSLFGGK